MQQSVVVQVHSWSLQAFYKFSVPDQPALSWPSRGLSTLCFCNYPGSHAYTGSSINSVVIHNGSCRQGVGGMCRRCLISYFLFFYSTFQCIHPFELYYDTLLIRTVFVGSLVAPESYDCY